MRVCAGWADSQDMLIIRFGDQMNNVAVTDGDKVEAEQRMGYHVDYCPVSELMEYHKEIKAADVDALVATYFKEYDHESSLEDKSTEAYQKVWNAAKAELAIRAILKAKGAKGFTTNFDDLGDIEYMVSIKSRVLLHNVLWQKVMDSVLKVTGNRLLFIVLYG